MQTYFLLKNLRATENEIVGRQMREAGSGQESSEDCSIELPSFRQSRGMMGFCSFPYSLLNRRGLGGGGGLVTPVFHVVMFIFCKPIFILYKVEVIK